MTKYIRSRYNVDIILSNIVVVGILAIVVVAFVMQVQESVVGLTCGREGYPTVRRTGITTVSCFKVENGSTVRQ